MSATEDPQQPPPNGLKSPSVGDNPHQVASKVGDKVAQNAGVASLEDRAGGDAVKTGTAFPVADLANKDAKNAGSKKADSTPVGATATAPSGALTDVSTRSLCCLSKRVLLTFLLF